MNGEVVQVDVIRVRDGLTFSGEEIVEHARGLHHDRGVPAILFHTRPRAHYVDLRIAPHAVSPLDLFVVAISEQSPRESVMAFVTTGLTNGGVTTHYRFSYDQSLAGAGGPEPARTNAAIAACEADYDLMSGWFGGGLTVTGMSVQVTTQSNGASWSGTSTSSTRSS